ncbi:MAG TPA: hypothetical protein PLG07_04350, partial [Phenylobacterium sp.]|nr:hypothetical protein [Phenylobacterium sp.]
MKRAVTALAAVFTLGAAPVTAPAFDLASVADNVVRNGSAVVLASAVPAVIVSHGANARGSYGPGGAASPAGGDARELENGDGD